MSDTHRTRAHSAGAFDVRNFIALLIGIYGVVLLLLGLFAFNAEESARTDGMNANLWAGIVMIAFAVLFALWAKVRPVKVVETEQLENPE
ncbi:hypothetical protein [Enemella evansiae]|uniref:Uncharacterized protein n=1 Tax=Enemella evansiae TaxID=2016499 RepID=A0A255GDI5_9ACTN|nr:hypothetical protein [Enemella evansiae]OYO03058.1 hypothetical protein CGZ95_04505 [Enemella evansiae]OYO03741.1 hypothetical protein CGZ97_10015 [Enemella evansiae]OYO13512.1 hypothetical protein CGZ94_11115 [Enemella evansiae]